MREKKDFLSDEYKEIEENNRMGKTKDLLAVQGTLKSLLQHYSSKVSIH